MQKPNPDPTIPIIETSVLFKGHPCGYLFSSEMVPAGCAYPANVVFNCPKCKSSHSFRSTGAHIISSPSKVKAFEAYCDKLHVTERDVKIYT